MTPRPEDFLPSGGAQLWALVLVLGVALLHGGCRGGDQGGLSFGVCTPTRNTALVKTSGYDYVEPTVQAFLAPYESEQKFSVNLVKAQAAGLHVRACNSFLPGFLKATGPEADPGAILAYADTAFRRARMAGVQIIVFGSSASRSIPDGFDRQEGRRQFVSLLRHMGAAASRHGVTVALEPLNVSECNFINTLSEAADVAREVSHPGILVVADFYHMARQGESPDSIVAAGDLVVHAHIAEPEGRTFPGSAGFDFRPYFAALKRIGYRGGISCECSWGDSMERGLRVALETMRAQR